MERLSSLDASFLRIESPTAHMHVGWISTAALAEGERELDVDRLRASIAARLQFAPRFRRRLLSAGLGEPILIDDPQFSIERQVRVRRSGAAPMSEAQLRSLSDQFLSTQLDRSHPLWEILVVPRLAGGRAAVMGKVHHALVDGIAAVELGMLLFDLAPEAAPIEVDDWTPERPPSPARALLESTVGTAVDQFRDAGQLARLGLEPRRAVRLAGSMRRAAFSLAESIANPAPESFLNKPISPMRTLATRSISMDRLARLRERSGLKLNDIVLAITTGALRDAHLSTGRHAQPLRAMVPISVRSDTDGEASGNRIVLGFIDLPLDLDAPRARVGSITEQMEELKRNGSAEGADALLRAAGRMPGPLRDRVEELAAAPRTYNLTVSNVPGPRMALYACGCRVESIFPVIPLSDGHSLAVGVLSYGGQLNIALHADPAALPETEDIAGLFPLALAELERSFAADSVATKERSREPDRRGALA